MSLTTARNNVNRVAKVIADLKSRDATEASNEARHEGNYNRATIAASKASSINTMENKSREAERHNKSLAGVQKKRADLSRQISQKTTELNRYKSQLEKAEKDERTKIEREEKRRLDNANKAQESLERKRKLYQRQLLKQNNDQIKAVKAMSMKSSKNLEEYDVFISHASEDKDSFVREFAEKLDKAGIKVWYDEFSLKWGDGLRRNIDTGLAKSRYGIVILSNHFFSKEWPQRELDGLFALEVGQNFRILPIWHKITKDEVTQRSPMIADKFAMNTSIMSVDEIVSELINLLN